MKPAARYEAALEAAYRKLNPSQRQAVDQIEGPVLVLAGPGTGKTQIVATRIARIINSTDTPPESILALTFTDSGVKALRLRLLEFLGPVAYRVGIYTFHSFCTEIIRAHPEDFDIGSDPQPLSDLERYTILKQIIEAHPWRALRPINAPEMFLPALIDAIQNLKREGIMPNKLQALVESARQTLVDLKAKQAAGEKVAKTKLAELEKQDQKLTDLAEIYYFYEKAVQDQGRFDFEDMINHVVRKLNADETLRLALQEQFQYFLVDEFQDSNSAQLNLLQQLTSYWGETANLFAVGDPNQSIYRFQGASFENLLLFMNQFPQALVVGLTANYRSHQTILNAAHALIGTNPELEFGGISSRLKLSAQSQSKPKRLKRGVFDHGLVEQYFIGQEIRRLLERGVVPGSIAIIFKKNQEAHELVPLLEHFNIPFQLTSGGDLLEDPQIRLLIRLLRLVASIASGDEDAASVFEFFSLPFIQVDPVDLLKLNRAAAKNKQSVVDLLASASLKSLDLHQPDIFKQLLERLSSWSRLQQELSLTEFVQRLAFESQYLSWLESQPDSFAKLARLKGFLDFVAGLERSQPKLRLLGLVDHLELMGRNRLRLEAPELGLQPGRVTLTTAHKTKGLEWDYCFIYRLTDGQWGNPNRREMIRLPEGILKFSPRGQTREEQNQDERRLFYVALTRARKDVYLTYAQRYPDSSREAVPSLFLAELPEQATKRLAVKATTANATKSLTALLTPVSGVQVSGREKAWLKTVIDTELSLSASALTTYQQCAYKFKLKYLAKIPEAQAAAMIYGTAIHRSLELFFKQIKQGVVPSLETLLTNYHAVLEHQPLSEEELQRRHHFGEQVLTAYYQQHEDEFPTPLFIERWFGSRQPLVFKGVPLSGKVDRIDILDPVSKRVKVVDYKTGEPKSLNHVLGQTAEKDDSQLTQLLFYKLLGDLDPSFDYSVAELELDFVEGPQRTKTFKRPRLAISDEQVENLKQTIESVYKQIRKLEFPRTTDYRICQRCPFQHHCWPDGIPRVKTE